jgi:hypothetical protein
MIETPPGINNAAEDHTTAASSAEFQNSPKTRSDKSLQNEMINNPRRKQTDPNLPKNKTLWFKFFV